MMVGAAFVEKPRLILYKESASAARATGRGVSFSPGRAVRRLSIAIHQAVEGAAGLLELDAIQPIDRQPDTGFALWPPPRFRHHNRMVAYGQ